jgi:hypothetical protein
LDGTFITIALIALFAWERSTSFSSVFSKLHLNPGEIESITAAKTDPYANRITGAAATDRNRLLQGFFREWVVGGLVLGICAVLTTYQFSDIGQAVSGTLNIRTISRLGLRSELLIALLIYFVCGLWLASLGRLEVMRSRWLMDGITFDRQVSKRWQRNSVLLLALVALIAAFLPIGSTFAIARILQSLAAVIVFIAAALFAILGAIYYLLTILLSGAAPESAEEPLELTMPEFIQPPEPPPIDNTPALIFGTIFWAIIVVVSIAAIPFFLRDRGIGINFGVFAQIWRRLALWLKIIWLGLTPRSATANRICGKGRKISLAICAVECTKPTK